ncbi:MAG: quinone oxidoreductase [Candidatus Lambdaproteobacteria bacterium]|nr:quinone oxidoreductase [Candidatus Lambdaproteobacteria bacterium]
MKAIRFRQVGGPEVLQVEELPRPEPGPGELLLQHATIGVNFNDVAVRSGRPRVALPFIPGREAAGTVVAVGSGVTRFAPGDRVAFSSLWGSYAEFMTIPAARAVVVPREIDFTMAAAALLQGMTAHYLTHDVFPLEPGDVCLVQAGAGGTGQLVIQMAKLCGATVFATVSTDEKAALAREAGADHVILYTREDIPKEVGRLLGNRGLDVVYDSVGRSTFEQSLAALRRRGMLALYGQSSGPVPPFDLNRLQEKGIFVTRTGLSNYTGSSADLRRRAAEVFHLVSHGLIRPHIHKTYALAEAAVAHAELESRRSAGKILLIP